MAILALYNLLFFPLPMSHFFDMIYVESEWYELPYQNEGIEKL